MKTHVAFLVLVLSFMSGCDIKMPGTNTSEEPETFSTKIIVSVPYWTSGDVYLGSGSEETLLLMDRVNDSTYTKEASLEAGASYYFTSVNGAESKRSIGEFIALKNTYTEQAVIDWKDSTKSINKPGFMKGVTFGGMLWDEENRGLVEQNLPILDEFNVGCVAIIPNWFAFGDTAEAIRRSTDFRPFYPDDGTFPNTTGWISPTLTDDELRSIIWKARENGKKVMLKPHLTRIDAGMEVGLYTLQPLSDKWDEWFAHYQEFILHYAEIAQAEGVELLCVGCELDDVTMPTNEGVEPDVAERWKTLIAEVRKKYTGKLLYSVSAAGDGLGPSKIKFWDALDYIGFEPYFGFSNVASPPISDLEAAFNKKLDELAWPLYNEYKKPIIFSEANCYSHAGIFADPLSQPAEGAVPNPQAQADYYEALFRSIEGKDWIAGVFWWAWYLDSTAKGDEERQYTQDCYDPFVRKPAGQVLRKWFGKISTTE